MELELFLEVAKHLMLQELLLFQLESQRLI